ncbi:MAG: hypothetical protein KIT84_06720 [Labilithrix sp.]|nr:hypothetical protein [Labilithrix sp.]MCW5810686.1 hypothetical protein [Labilithrix sp.]
MKSGVAAIAALLVLVLACGESRRPIGDECIRDEDCLSDVCAARVCAPAPGLVSGASNPPPPEEPRIPTDGGATGIADAESDS